jgi:hypothetical protein
MEGGLTVYNSTERKVRDKLTAWFGRGEVESAEPVEPGVFRARLMGGGLAYAIVEDDGSIIIDEREAVC